MSNNEEIAKKCTELVEKSKEVIRESFTRFALEDMAVTWTGGKDSSLTLWIIRQVCEEKGIPLFKAMIIGEGDEFQEIEEFVERMTKEWNVPLEWCRNEDVLKAANFTLSAPVRVKDLNENTTPKK